jgi:quinone-modifying oxidoreductase subunit QmoC
MIEIRPDIAFIEKLQATTGSQLTTCMQCGACTASCSLSVDQDVFPRRQMIMAAWGMREQLMADPYIWTCHQCGDCTVSCPRQVKPGDILAALRQEQIAHYSRPGFLARWMQRPALLPIVILLPVAVICLVIMLAGTLHIPEGPVDYSKFFPHGWLNGSFTALFILSTIGAVAGLRRFWKNLKPGIRNARETEILDAGESGISDVRETELLRAPDPVSSPIARQPGASLSGSFISVIGRIMRHRDFRQCVEQKNRSLSHFLVFWGFILLLFVTFFAILSTIFFNYPLGFRNPVKIAGNAGALLLFTGSTMMVMNRLIKRNSLRSSYTDWFFLVTFWMLTVSGIMVESARFLDWNSAYHIYFFHLVMVWMIILYYPYTKFAHFLYRTSALLLIRIS